MFLKINFDLESGSCEIETNEWYRLITKGGVPFVSDLREAFEKFLVSTIDARLVKE